MQEMPRITEVSPLEDYRLHVKYSDGAEGTVDLSDLVGKGVFALWNDYEAFLGVTIGSSGELVWGDEVDLCPDSLYLRLTGKRPQDIFPNLGRNLTHA